MAPCTASERAHGRPLRDACARGADSCSRRPQWCHYGLRVHPIPSFRIHLCRDAPVVAGWRGRARVGSNPRRHLGRPAPKCAGIVVFFAERGIISRSVRGDDRNGGTGETGDSETAAAR